MIDPRQLHEAAARFAPAVTAETMGFDECYAHLCRAAFNNPACRDMPTPAFDAFCERLGNTLSAAIDQPALAASQAVRDAIRPLLATRRPRDTVMLAAYRAAGDALLHSEIEAVTSEEVRHHVENRRAG